MARVRGKSGNTVEIEGLAKGQTVLRINHTESMNEKAVVLYVVAKGESAEGKIVIGIETTNYVMAVNQSLFLRLVTNAGEAQKLGFRWKTNYADKVHIDDNYDTAVITAKEAGNVKVTVYEKDGRNVIDLDIFITIKEQQSYQGELGYPDSVILVKNQYKAVKGNAVGIARDGVKDVEYNFEEQGIASLIGGGLEVTLRGEEAGRTFLTVTSGGMNYYKKILVICVENENDLDNVYYFTVDKALHRIKTGDEIKVNLTFGENGFPETEKALIQWRNTSGNDAVLISPNGGGASVVGRNEGQAVIQITSRLAPKPVEVVVEVGGDAKGSDYYRFVCAPIHQTVKDAVTMLPVSIYYGNDYYDQDDRYNPGMKMETGYSGIEVAVADASVAEAAMAGQSLRVNAKKAGRTEITLSHGLIAEDAKLLVAVYEGAVPPAGEDLIIYAPKKHWLIPKGQTQAVTLITSGDAGGGGILWNNRNPALFTVDSGAKTAAKVTALKEGSGTVAVEYGGKLVETIYVSVPGDGDFANAAVATESVIILSKEELHAGYTTRIVVNGGSESGITWEAADTGVISVTGLGTSCQIWPAGLGVTELEVKGNGFRKTIIVKVVDTEAEKLSARLMNLDQRYFKLKKGQSVTLNPYYKADKPSGPAEAELVYDNRVVQVEKSGGGIAVTGKNVGVERLRLWNAECENGLEVTFEVDETASGGVGEVMNLAYMTAQNGVIIMEPGAKDYYVPVSVIGEYAGSEADFKWKSSSANVQVSGMGAYAFVSAGNKEGEADITVSNRHCAGELKIKVIVGKKFDFENNDVPYLYAERNVYTVDKGGGGLVIPLEIRNVSPVDYNKVSVACSGSAVTAKFANGSLAVAGMDAGVGTITAKYEGVAQALTVYVIVREGGKGGTAYLTTGQNYVIVNKNDTRVVDVSLVNYTEPDSSAYKWSSGDASIAHVIGNGRTVQILGMNEGVTKVTVKHPESYNDLDILVKVAPAGSAESVCYLTTGDNVIETYVSTNSSEITVNKVGGKTAAADAVWSVDDPTVVGIMGSGSACYYTPKKAGIAKITASDREAGSLSIVVIVRKTKPGDQFIMARENVKQITPGSTNNALSVYLTDGEDIDERDFKWEIYSQLPGSVEVARQGGSVISLFGMGSRATVGGIYAGTAKVKVTHPKAAQALFLVVQVTNFASMRFGQRDVVIASEDMTYVTLETPDYENYAGKVKFSTDNPAVCTVVGSSKAALLSARQAGKAVITAYVEGTDLKAETAVTVVPEMSFNQPDIVTGKTTYPLNPREKPFVISASILGFGVGDQDNDSLVWKVKGIEDYKKPMIKIYPENYEYDDGPGVIRKGSQGRHIQVEVLNRKYETPENCIIEISCPSLTSKVRTVFLQVQEDSNAFTVSKRSLTVQSGEMAELSCSIIGGSNKDYEEVVWVAQKDGFDPTKDIVKVMGRGRSVQVLGMADGVTNVTAVYRGLMDNCAVVVKSSVYFNIQYQYFLKYPKARNDDGGLVEIGYEVRPVTAPIQWIDTDGDSAKKIANYSVTQAKDDGDGTGRGVILFDFLREGTFTLMGISNSKSAKVIITVQNIYHFGLQPHFIDQTPTDYAVNRNDKPRTRADNTVNYTVSPGNARIAVKGGNAAINSLLDKGVEVEIGKAVSGGGGDLRSSGVIYVNNKREIIGDTVITFELLTPEGEPAGYEQELTLTSRYPKGVARLVPVFERVYGQYSNSGGAKNYPIANRKGDKDVSQSNLPTGVNYNAGQYLKPVSIPSYNASSHTDTYELVIGDGEEHYILLDKLNNNAAIEVSKIEYVSNGDVLGAPGRMPSGAEVKSADKNSLPSFKISGGKDYIVYDYFGTNFDLTCTLSSGNAGRDYYYVSIPTSYTNTDHGLSTSLSDFNKDNIVGSASPVNDGKVVAYYYYDGNSLSYVNYVVYGGSMGSYTGGSPSPGYTTGNYRYSMKTNGVFYLLTSDGKYVKYENIPYNIYSSKLIQTYSYVSQAINATETRWNPVTNEYSGGNIRVSLGHGYNMVGGKFVSYMDVYPKVLSGSYEVDFASDNPRTPWGMSGNCGLIVEGGEKRIRNFITGRTYTWGSGDPTEDKSKLTGNTPFDGIFYDNDPMYGGDGERGQVHIKISRGVYSKRVGNYYSNVITFQRILPFGMLNPESGNGDNFIVPLIDIFNERYEAAKETIPLGPKDFPEVDRENFEKYPYRYFPLPSTNFGLVYNRYKCGTITVEYNTAYATGSEKSKIIIGVYHEVRQCAANYINERERIAMGWNELERVAIPKGFKDPVYKDDSSIYNGKLWMPKNY
ncbi:MAG: hypothetical protein LBG95_01330 [Treponema sp.]|nr:hypothetical protein [Treponema sp.]